MILRGWSLQPLLLLTWHLTRTLMDTSQILQEALYILHSHGEKIPIGAPKVAFCGPLLCQFHLRVTVALHKLNTHWTSAIVLKNRMWSARRKEGKGTFVNAYSRLLWLQLRCGLVISMAFFFFMMGKTIWTAFSFVRGTPLEKDVGQRTARSHGTRSVRAQNFLVKTALRDCQSGLACNHYL